MIFRSRAPVRLELAGGATDMPPYDKEHGGIVVNAAINKYAYTTLIPRADNKVAINSVNYNINLVLDDVKRIVYDGKLDMVKACIKLMQPDFGFDLILKSDVPLSCGLGSSASAAVSLIGMLNYVLKKKMNLYDVAELAFEVEDEIKNAGGRQDQYASAFGKINFMEFKGDSFVRVNPIPIRKRHRLELEKHALITHIGLRDSVTGSGKIVADQQKSYSKEEKKIQLDKMKEITFQMRDALMAGDLRRFGELLSEEWKEKTIMNPVITTDYVENLRKIAAENGAIGSRLMGAGRGGFLVVYCDDNKEHAVANKLEEAGTRVSPFAFDFDGMQVWETNK